MSSRIARSVMAMAVAVAIVPLGVGAIGSAAAQPPGAGAQDCLTNRSDSPVSETDARYASRRDRREAAPATGLLGLTSCRASLVPQVLSPAS